MTIANIDPLCNSALSSSRAAFFASSLRLTRRPSSFSKLIDCRSQQHTSLWVRTSMRTSAGASAVRTTRQAGAVPAFRELP